MTDKEKTREDLLAEIEELKLRLTESEETLDAIRGGEVDAVVVSGSEGVQIYSLEGTDMAYRTLIEEMNQGAAILMNDGTIFYCNSRLADMIKVSLGDIIGSSLDNFVYSSDLSMYYALLEKSLKSHSSAEISLMASDGTVIPVYVSSQNLKIKEVEGISLNITDLSEQKRNEMIIKSERLSRCIFEQAGESIIVCDAEGVITRASNVASKFFEFNPILKYFDDVFKLYDENMDIFSIKSVLNSKVIDQMEVNSYKKDGSKSHSLLSTRTLRDGNNKIFGCVIVLTDITERKKTEEKLKESETRLSSLMDNTSDVIVRFNLQTGLYDFVSSSIIDLVGYTSDEFIDMDSETAFKMVHPNDLSVLMEAMVRLEETGKGKAEYRQRTKNGNYIWVSNHMTIEKDSSDNPIYRISAIRDVTGRKKDEETLKELYEIAETDRNRLNTLISSIPSAIVIMEQPDGKISFINEHAKELYGYDPTGLKMEEHPHIGLLKLDGTPYLPEEMPASRSLLDGEVVRNEDLILENPDGKSIIVSASSAPIYNKEGEIRAVIGIFDDITERKKLEEKIKESEKKLLAFIEATSDVVYFMSPDWTEMHLLRQDFIPDTYSPRETWMDKYIHPDDQQHVQEVINKAIKSKSTFELEHRVQQADGTLGWTFSRAIPILDENNKIIEWFGTAKDVTEKKIAEEELKQSYKSLYMAQRIGSIGNWEWNLQTGEIEWSNELYNIYELDPNTFTPTIESFSEYVHPDDKELVNKIIDQIYSEGKTVDFDFRIISDKGSTRVLNTKAKITDFDEKGNPLQMKGINQDITERKKLEETIKESEARFRLLIQNLEPGVALVDENGIFSIVNPSFMRLFDLDDEMDILNVNSQDWGLWKVYGEDCKLLHVDEHPVRRVLLTGEPVKDQLIAVQNPGAINLKWMLVSAESILNRNGGNSMTICTYYDVTELKKSQELLQKNEEELEKTIMELYRSNKDLEQFAYVASHDLQEPLRSISGFLQLLTRRFGEKLDPKAKEYVNRSVNGTIRMQNMIEDLLAYSRVSSMGKTFQLTETNLIVDDVISDLKSIIKENNASVSHENLPQIIADDSQIYQVFQNLINNAIKFHQEKPTKIFISAEENDNEWIFSVKDNGIGIDSKYQEEIFEIFKRLHSRRKYSGTGIGLAIVRKIVERHGGKLWVDSKLGEGSTFYFTINKKGEISK